MVTDPHRPDPASEIVVISRALAGGWLLQDGSGATQAHFASFDEAQTFARDGTHGLSGATLATSCAPGTGPIRPRIAGRLGLSRESRRDQAPMK